MNSLARTLAERAADELWNDLSDFQREVCDDAREAEWRAFIAAAIEPVEAVIREAIDKTLDEAERLAELRGECAEIGGLLHDLNEQYKRGVIDSARQIQDAIRSLKQSNSGMEVRK